MQLFLFLHVFESSIAFDSNYDYQHKIVTNKVLSLRVSDKCSKIIIKVLLPLPPPR